jgi:hypothetical protein
VHASLLAMPKRWKSVDERSEEHSRLVG